MKRITEKIREQMRFDKEDLGEYFAFTLYLHSNSTILFPLYFPIPILYNKQEQHCEYFALHTLLIHLFFHLSLKSFSRCFLANFVLCYIFKIYNNSYLCFFLYMYFLLLYVLFISSLLYIFIHLFIHLFIYLYTSLLFTLLLYEVTYLFIYSCIYLLL